VEAGGCPDLAGRLRRLAEPSAPVTVPPGTAPQNASSDSGHYGSTAPCRASHHDRPYRRAGTTRHHRPPIVGPPRRRSTDRPTSTRCQPRPTWCF